jgi:Zn-dependent protease with chaperone function
MEIERFKHLVSRLEIESAASPGRYQLKVALLALLGVGVIGVVLSVAGFGLLVLVALALALLWKGGLLLLVLLKFAKLLILLALPLWFLVRASLRALFVRLPPPAGLAVVRADAPALFAALDRMRRQLKGPPVHQVLLIDEINAAIVQRPLFGLVGWPRNHLLLGLPLLDSLAPEEALAVVAHEYGHLAGSHGRFGAFIYRLRLSWATIDAVASHWRGPAGGLLRRLVGAYAPYFNAYTFVLARANEFEADRASVDLVGAAAAASALKRVNLAGAHHHAFLGETFEQVIHVPQPPADLQRRWAEVGSLSATQPQAARWLGDALDREGQWHDTHPTLRARLAALTALEARTAPGGACGSSGDAQALLDALPPAHVGPSAATVWLGARLPEWREQLQAAWTERVAEPWRARHDEAGQQRQRLAALRAQPEPSSDEQLECLRLRARLEPSAELADDVAAFNAAHAGHAPALYLEGSLRLDHGDEAGLVLIERAITIDADATKPGCERCHAFLAERRDPRADDYAQRWRARDALERGRQEQAQALVHAHALAPAALPAEEQQAVLRHLESLQGLRLRGAYLVRRRLPADPSFTTCVLALDFSWWARRRGQPAQAVQRLAALEWPFHLFVCDLGQQPAAWQRKLQAVAGARLR